MKAFAGSRGKLPAPRGKTRSLERLPNRHALAELTQGDPIQRSLGNYAKLTPSGANAIPTYDEITQMGLPKAR